MPNKGCCRISSLGLGKQLPEGIQIHQRGYLDFPGDTVTKAIQNMSRTEVSNHLPRAENTKPKLLFLAHPFPPAHIIGAVRTWNIAKHLSRLGWEVTVVTPHPSLRADVDDSGSVEANIEREGIKIIHTGHNWRYLYPTALRTSSNPFARLGRAAARILAKRLGLDAGVGWIGPAMRSSAQLTPGDVDVILASGSPYASFELASRLAHRLKAPYVLDYRDPWTGRRNSVIARRVKRKEEALLKGAAVAIAVSSSWARVLTEYFSLGSKVHAITNGYDPEEIAKVKPQGFDHFAIVYAGVFYPPRRVVTPLMAALSHLKNSQKQWYFHYYGRHQAHVIEEANRFGVRDRVVLHGFVPRQECLSAIRGASVALAINPAVKNPTPHELGWIPGKLFELVGLRTPILFLGSPLCDAADIVRGARNSGVFAPEDTQGIASFLDDLMYSKPNLGSGCRFHSWPQLAIKLDRVLRNAARLSQSRKLPDYTALVSQGSRAV